MNFDPPRDYVTAHSRGFQVRLPARVSRKTKFFTFDNAVISEEDAKIAACLWRDEQFRRAGQPVFARIVGDPNAGVFLKEDNGNRYAVAVWMSEDKQVKRMFSVEVYGLPIAGALAHIARDLGVLLEADRLAGTYRGHPCS